MGETFTLEELRLSVRRATEHFGARDQQTQAVARKTLMLAQSNYEVQFAPDSRLSERVLFPVTPSQSNGIEDARFVRFQNDDGARTYCATYTAYDGKLILPQFIETPDFLHYKFITLNGPAVQNKGMALCPRKIRGGYAMLGRQDAENISLMFSDHLHFWHTAQILLRLPLGVHSVGQLWLPVETEAGWLCSPRRRADAQILHRCVCSTWTARPESRRLREPLIKPNENEREDTCPASSVVIVAGWQAVSTPPSDSASVKDTASRHPTALVRSDVHRDHAAESDICRRASSCCGWEGPR